MHAARHVQQSSNTAREMVWVELVQRTDGNPNDVIIVQRGCDPGSTGMGNFWNQELRSVGGPNQGMGMLQYLRPTGRPAVCVLQLGSSPQEWTDAVEAINSTRAWLG